ncbi:hypothetical protein [Cellulomonas chitinilytica]|uniref:hypothetical protein n=1 Tax=Cellulomonas chitinilytica TaxID=398759 RepID=UPI001EF37201|nr:hypothetical protein [Cellulomonas chitinilytica]
MSTTSGTDTDAGPDDVAARPTPASVRRDASTDGTAGAPSAGPTGDAHVDEALTRLDGLDDAPLREHVAAFDAVHGALQDRLADAEGAGA